MAAKAAAKITDNQTAMVLGAGLLLVVGGVWYLDYRARSVIGAVSHAAGVAVDTVQDVAGAANQAAKVGQALTPVGIVTGIATGVAGMWGNLLGFGKKVDPASDQGVL